MIVLNYGLPRSGTVWTNAVIRACLQRISAPHRSMNVGPADLVPNLDRIAASGAWRWRVLILHLHDWSDAAGRAVAPFREAGQVLAFCNYRDPRDVAVSLMRLHDQDLDHAILLTRGYGRMQAGFRRDLAPALVRYESARADPARFVAGVARVMGIALDAEAVAQVVAETSQEAAARKMAAVRAGAVPRPRRIRNVRRVLVECADSHITDRHIQSGESGRWRRELPPAEAARLAAALDPLARGLGYVDGAARPP